MVTGGAGTIGSHVVDELLDAGAARVVVVDNMTRGRLENLAAATERAPEKVEVVEGDIRDAALVRKLTEGNDLVFHLAAIRITQCAEEPRPALEVLVDGTFNVIEAAVEAGVSKVVSSSSASVYGLAEEFPTTERHHPYNNDTFYGAAKAFNEGMLRSFKAMHGLDYVALRYFNVYGPRMDISRPLHRGADPLDGAHRVGRAAADPRRRPADHGLRARRRHRPRQHPGGPGRRHRRRVFNIASGTETSLMELAQALSAVDEVGPGAGARPGPRGQRRHPPPGRHQRAPRRTWAGRRIGLHEGLEGLVDWWRAQR